MLDVSFHGDLMVIYCSFNGDLMVIYWWSIESIQINHHLVGCGWFPVYLQLCSIGNHPQPTQPPTIDVQLCLNPSEKWGSSSVGSMIPNMMGKIIHMFQSPPTSHSMAQPPVAKIEKSNIGITSQKILKIILYHLVIQHSHGTWSIQRLFLPIKHGGVPSLCSFAGGYTELAST